MHFFAVTPKYEKQQEEENTQNNTCLSFTLDEKAHRTKEVGKHFSRERRTHVQQYLRRMSVNEESMQQQQHSHSQYIYFAQNSKIQRRTGKTGRR